MSKMEEFNKLNPFQQKLILKELEEDRKQKEIMKKAITPERMREVWNKIKEKKENKDNKENK